MNSMKLNSKRKSYGPNIVRAWFDTVIHFALRGLETERELLNSRNWTFRFSNRDLEYIAPLTAHLPSESQGNLEQFISFFPEVAAEIQKHDSCVRRLEQVCNAYFDAIIRCPDFEQTFNSVESEAPAVLKREFGSNFGAYSSRSDYKAVLAEHLINNIGLLPSFYSTGEIWNQYRDRFSHVLAHASLTVHMNNIELEKRILRDSVDHLLACLRQTRAELSLEFDVPYVALLTSIR